VTSPQAERAGLLGLLRSHVTLIVSVVPILLSGMRIFAVADGDRATLVTLLSTLDVAAVLLGTFAWLLPTAFGVAAAVCWIRWLQLSSASPPLAGHRGVMLWLAIPVTVVALILFAFAPVNDLLYLLLCGLAVGYFRRPERNRIAQAVILVAAFLAVMLGPVVFRAANMWLPAERIQLRDQPAVVGYVLAADPQYATVLQAADSAVRILRLDQVESRTICSINPGLESASTVRYLTGSASRRTPPCWAPDSGASSGATSTGQVVRVTVPASTSLGQAPVHRG
jgi:hypothetical protein